MITLKLDSRVLRLVYYPNHKTIQIQHEDQPLTKVTYLAMIKVYITNYLFIIFFAIP